MVPRTFPLAAVAAVLLTPLPAQAADRPAPVRVLVTNDDGVKAPGIDALVQMLRKRTDVKVTVVAPLANQSGTGGKITPGALEASRTTTASGFPAIAVKGFPADSVRHAWSTVFKGRPKPQLVLSGINAGANIGPFVDLSGTVGAARAGASRGAAALALSQGLGEPTDFPSGVRQAQAWLERNLTKLRPRTVDSINIPTCAPGRVRGLARTTTGSSFGTNNAFAAVDCTQTTAAGRTDVDAYFAGFATIAKLSLKPAS